MLIRFLFSIGIIFLVSCAGTEDVKINPLKEEETVKEESTVSQKSGLTFAIQNSNGDHLGFLLMVGSTSGDCIFRSLPANPNNLETPESNHLLTLQNQGEFSWKMKQNNAIDIFDQSRDQVAWVNGTELKTDKFQLTLVDASKSKTKT